MIPFGDGYLCCEDRDCQNENLIAVRIDQTYLGDNAIVVNPTDCLTCRPILWQTSELDIPGIEKKRMSKEEFIEWADSKFGKDGSESYRDLVDYAECIYDYIDVEGDRVFFRWERRYWGGMDYVNDEYSFEEFIYRYQNYQLRD